MMDILLKIAETLINPYFFIPFLLIPFFCRILKGRRSPEEIQGVATLLGIFGTFLGIVIALSGLDSNNLSDGIPALLDEIYILFSSSLAGVLVSLWVYFRPKYWKRKESAVDEDSDTDSQILLELKNLNKNISGDSETSLSTQMLKLKDSITGKQDELKKSFDEFAEKVADNNMKALEEVIKDFNTKLQEQFGENFKQLNEAVGALLDWQENYKETVEKTNTEVTNMIQALESSKDSIKVSADALEKMTESADSFKENSDALQAQLEETRDSIVEIDEFAKGLSGAADTIKDNIDGIMGKVLEDLGQNLKGISEALVRDYREIQQTFESMKDSTNDSR